MGRSVVAIVTGLVAGLIVVFGVETLNGRLHPPPPGVDLGDPAAVRAAMAGLPARALIVVLAGWVLGSFVAGFITAKFRGRAPIRNGIIVGAILMAAGIANLFMLPHPVWFNVIAMLAFVPPAWVGARLSLELWR